MADKKRAQRVSHVENKNYPNASERFASALNGRLGDKRLINRILNGRKVKPCGRECREYGLMIAEQLNHGSFVNFTELMNDEGNNIFVYKLDPKYVGTEVTYYLEHSWYQTSTKTITLYSDSQSTAQILHTTYLEPGTWDWTSATFGAWLFEGTGADMMVTAVKVKDNFFEVEIPEGGYKKVIFVRCNKSSSTASWDTKWNQTDNLTLQNKCFCVNGWDNLGDSQWF